MLKGLIKKLILLNERDADYFDSQIDEFNHDLNNVLAERIIMPKNKKNHIGIEIEFLSFLSFDDVMDWIFELKLEDKLVLGYDGSVEGMEINGSNYPYLKGYELKIIDTEKNIFNTLKLACKILKKVNAVTNKSCGLHVHLDMRNRNKEKVAYNLYRIQEFLYSIVDKSRRDNQYCQFVYDPSIMYEDLHEYGIEVTAYDTIELRMHHGTTKESVIKKWITLLMKAANYKGKNLTKNNLQRKSRAA